MNLRTISGEGYERVVVFVGHRLAAAGHTRIAQSRAGSVVAEGQHNMDEADALLIGLDNRLRNLTFGLKLLKPAFALRPVDFAKRKCLLFCWMQFAISGLHSSFEVEASVDRSPANGSPSRIFKGPARTFHQLLLRQHSCLQSSDAA